MKSLGELKVWEKGHQLTLAVYESPRTFPQEELYGLTCQIRRACSSIPANIAGGWGRDGDTELARFLGIAMGSASEPECHLLLAHDLNLPETTEYKELTGEVTEVKRMLTSFIQELKADR
jgi:four helix bundle protein